MKCSSGLISYLLLFLSLLFSPVLMDAATLRGVISDAAEQYPLPGAAIVIVGSGIGAVSSPDGSFTLSRIPAGIYTFRVSFIGYEQLDFTVEFTERDQVITKNIALVPSSEQLPMVMIEGRARGQVKALKRQEESENIMNVVDEEQIQSFPDLNAADAMQRITGVTLQRDQGEGRYVQLRGTPPEFTNFNVNGIQLPSPESEIRTVGMDVINASQIQTIEVSKVLRPDQLADAIGGSVNLVTKRAESTEPEVRMLVAGGFNNLRKTPNGEVQFSFAQRKDRFGFLFNGNYTYTEQGADNIEFKYEKGAFFGDTSANNYHLQYTEVQLRHYDIIRQRTGLSATFDYLIDEFTTVYLSGMFNRFSDDETRRRKVYNLDDAISERKYLYGGIEHDLKDRTKEQSISMINLGVEHQYYRAIIDYEIAWSLATELQPDRMDVVFENPGQAIFIEFDVTDPEYPKATYPDRNNSRDATNYDRYDMDQLLFENHQAQDRNITGRFNVKLPYQIKGQNGYFKFGSLVQVKDKFRDIKATSYRAYFPNSKIYPLPGDTLVLTTVVDDFYEDNLLQQGYVLEAMPNPDNMRQFYEEFQNLFIYGDAGITETRERTYGQDYNASENVYTGYAMFRHDINKLMVMGGLRYEQTNIDYLGYRISKSSSGFITGLDTISDQRVQAFWLPNLQFKYRLKEGVNLRAAVTSSYARPNFRDVVPYRVQEERTEVRFGNPSIDYPLATNFDLMAEKYWGAGNMISAGYFYKNIDNFIFNYRIFGFEGDPRQANLSRVQVEIPINGDQAEVNGLEFQTQFMMRFLPGIWNNLGFFGNYTFTQSKAIINERLPANDFSNIIIFGEDYDDFFNDQAKETITLPGQAPHTLNLSFFYDSPKFYFRIAANYNESYLFSLGADRDLDEYYGEYWRLDINAYYQITPAIQIFSDWRNVTNEPLKFYLGDPAEGRISQQEFYSFWARLGIRINL